MKLSIIAGEKKEGFLFRFLAEVFLICLIAGSGTFLLCSFLESEGNLWFFFGIAAAVGSLAALSAVGRRRFFAGVLLFLSVLVTAGGFLSGVFVNGMIQVWNQMAEVLGRTSAIRLNSYELLAEETAKRDLFCFWIFLTGLFCITVFLMLRWGWGIGLLLLSSFVPVLMTVTGREMNERAGILFFAGILFGEGYILFFGKRKVRSTNKGRILCLELVFLLLAAGVGAGVWHLAVPTAKYQEPELLSSVREKSEDLCRKFRFRTGKINSLPKGRLDQMGAWKASEETALRIRMEEPQSFYLRGFVGSVYEKNRWLPLLAETYYENEDLFYWLNEEQFYGNRQLAKARALVSDDSLAQSEQKVTVENVAADREYVYVPYEMTELLKDPGESRAYGDDFIKARGFFGANSYAFQTMDNLVKDFPQLSAEVYLALKDGVDESYSEEESYYNSYVYQNAVQLPDSLKALFEKELGTAGDMEKGHIDYYSAISHIRKYLEENMTYGKQTPVVKSGNDFVKDFLTDSKIGHSVHFASAAVLMFRYYGIPARYVEGYLVTPEDVQHADASGTMEISGKNGHAWTEIYIDGTGWVPVEMTPEYYGVMEEPDLLKGLEANGVRVSEEPEEPEEEEEPETAENLKQLLQLAVYQIVVIVLWLILLFDLFCVLFFLYVVLRRAITVLRRKRSFAAQENDRAVRFMTGYAQLLYENGKRTTAFSEQTETLYRQAYRIGQKAAFSRHGVSAEERALVKRCCKMLLSEIRRMNGWYRKWIMKYMEQLY